MTASDMIRAALKETGKYQSELAAHMGWSRQNLSARLKNNSLTFDELQKALAFLGYEAKIVDADGQEIREPADDPDGRTAQMIGGVVYDTDKAKKLGSSKRSPSDKSFIDLYRAQDGSYFLVNRSNAVMVVPERLAVEILKELA